MKKFFLLILILVVASAFCWFLATQIFGVEPKSLMLIFYLTVPPLFVGCVYWGISQYWEIRILKDKLSGKNEEIALKEKSFEAVCELYAKEQECNQILQSDIALSKKTIAMLLKEVNEFEGYVSPEQHQSLLDEKISFQAENRIFEGVNNHLREEVNVLQQELLDVKGALGKANIRISRLKIVLRKIRDSRDTLIQELRADGALRRSSEKAE